MKFDNIIKSIKTYGIQRFEFLVSWSKDVILPFLGNVPLYYIVKFIVEEFQKESIVTRANSIAFSFFLSLFPFVIFILPILAKMPFAIDYFDRLESSLVGIIPNEALHYMFGIIDEVSHGDGYGYSFLGIVLAAYFASSGMLTLMSGFEKSYKSSFDERSWFMSQLIALGLTVLLSFLLIFSVVFVVFGGMFLSWLVNSIGLPDITVITIQILRWLTTLLLIYVVISIIYRYGPSLIQRTKFWNPGSMLASILVILVSLGFSYFVNNFGRYNEIYGSIGALIVILLWFKFVAFILLIGFELNASIAVNQDLNNLSRKEVE